MVADLPATVYRRSLPTVYRRRLRRVVLRVFFVNLPLALRGCLAAAARWSARVRRLNLPERGEWKGLAILFLYLFGRFYLPGMAILPVRNLIS